MELRVSATILAGLVGCLGLIGCSSNGDDDDDDNGTVTYYEDVKAITNENCAGCHKADSIAPFALETFDQAVSIGSALVDSTQNRTMPPSNVDASGACQEYHDPRWLSDDQIDTIKRWVDGGMLEGDPANDPGAPNALPTLAEVDLSLDMGFEYTPSAAQNDDYRCFVVDAGQATDMYITGYDVHPGDATVVHHVVLFSLDSAQAQSDAEAMDTGTGYTCFGGAGVSDTRPLLVWAPGTGATEFAEGTGVLLPANNKAVIQVHYNLLAGTKPDRTTIDLDLAASANEGFILPIGPTSFSLPAGQTDASVSASFPLSQIPVPVRLHSIYPHMHLLGKTMTFERTNANGTECLASVPDWDFDWQQFFPYAAPITLSPSDTLNISCTYDTTGASGPTTFGEGTEDEMCFAIVYVSL